MAGPPILGLVIILQNQLIAVLVVEWMRVENDVVCRKASRAIVVCQGWSGEHNSLSILQALLKCRLLLLPSAWLSLAIASFRSLA